MRSSLIAVAASLSAVSAVYQGFNYGATKSDGSFMFQADYEAKFKNAQQLVGTSGFSSARLYTMIVSSYSNAQRAVTLTTDSKEEAPPTNQLLPFLPQFLRAHHCFWVSGLLEVKVVSKLKSLL